MPEGDLNIRKDFTEPQIKMPLEITAALKPSKTLLEWLQMIGLGKYLYISEPIHTVYKQLNVYSEPVDMLQSPDLSRIGPVCDCIA